MAQTRIRFGAHTLTHPILARTETAEVKHEIATSKALIESRIDRRVDYFAYPDDSVCRAALDAVDAAGFQAAFAGARHVGQTPVDRLTVGRLPWDLGPVSVFAAEVSGLLNALRDLVAFLS
jgi:peptidoglycan/xylan/chitin deacetylase (PgdA/CDA1 family)